MESNEVCIGGNRYKIVDANANSYDPSPIVESPQIAETDGEKLDKVVDILGGGQAGYAFVKLEVPINNNQYEVNLGINATQMHIRCDTDISLKLNDRGGDDIELLANDFPFTMSELRPNESIERLFITTGATSGAVIQVIAIGYR